MTIATPEDKRNFKELQYKNPKRIVRFSFNGTLRHKAIFTCPTNHVILPSVCLTVTEPFDNNTRVNLGIAEDYRAICHGSLDAEIGPVQLYLFSGGSTILQKLLERDTIIYIGMNQTSSKGKCWGLIEYVNMSLLKEVRL